jgi:hypothetical protein
MKCSFWLLQILDWLRLWNILSGFPDLLISKAIFVRSLYIFILTLLLKYDQFVKVEEEF